ncbi:unnamed protein product, partial [Ectocarpus sp. 12 AP-2014]
MHNPHQCSTGFEAFVVLLAHLGGTVCSPANSVASSTYSGGVLVVWCFRPHCARCVSLQGHSPRCGGTKVTWHLMRPTTTTTSGSTWRK